MSRSTRILQGVEWSQSGRASGLLRATITLPAEIAQAASKVRVSIDGRDVELLSKTADAWPSPILANIHTHLLDDGVHAFAICLAGDGAEWESASVKIDIGNTGALAERVRASLQQAGSPLVFAGPCDASHYDYQNIELRPWFDREDADQHIDKLLASKKIDAAEACMLREFIRDGFLVMPERLPDQLIDAACAAIDDAVAKGYQDYRYGESQRLEQMHANYPAIRALWLHPRIHQVLELLFGEASEPCQSLVYVFGSQQDAHQDTIHLTPYPAGYMCGVWIALEDVREDSGELLVYPGSHKLPRVYMKDAGCGKVANGDWSEFGSKVVTTWGRMIEEGKFSPKPYLAKRGSVLIWHENLMHAGSVRRDLSLSRRSVVTHNFARGALVYYDSTGLAGTTFQRR